MADVQLSEEALRFLEEAEKVIKNKNQLILV